MTALPPVILLVDANPDDSALATAMLCQGLPEYRVDRVEDVLAFTERVGRGEFSAVVTEATLPWSSGLDVAATIHALYPDRPVVVFTDSGSEDLAAAALERGLAGYVVKGSAGYLRLAEVVRTAVQRAEESRVRKMAQAPGVGSEELQQLIYAISHDLQEPIHLIGRYTRMLGERSRNRLDEESRRYLAHVSTGAEQAQAMLDDILAYARVGTRGRPFEVVCLESVTARAVENLKAAIEESGGHVTWEPLPTLPVDPAQMTQVFQNLIANALKFRGAEPARVQISAAEEQESWIFLVQDNGIGIPEDSLDRIFGMFQRLHTTAEYPGSGIGLAICRRIVERHGGQIWATSEIGQGSTFYFTLPKRAAGSQAASAAVGEG